MGIQENHLKPYIRYMNTSQTQNIENKVVLITGASSGIGEATARLLAGAGATVVLGARRTDRLDGIVAEIRASGGTAEAKAVDVTRRDDVARFVKFANEKFGRVDVLFNNAGVMPLSPLNALKTNEWDNMIDVNIRGVLNGIAAVLPIMEQQARVTSSTPRPLRLTGWDRRALCTRPRSLLSGRFRRVYGRNRKRSA